MQDTYPAAWTGRDALNRYDLPGPCCCKSHFKVTGRCWLRRARGTLSMHVIRGMALVHSRPGYVRAYLLAQPFTTPVVSLLMMIADNQISKAPLE